MQCVKKKKEEKKEKRIDEGRKEGVREGGKGERQSAKMLATFYAGYK